MRIALFQPDIPQNTGTILRLGACLGVPVDVIEPCGFPFSESRFRRAAMDYADFAEVHRHASAEAFLEVPRDGRLVLMTTRATLNYADFAYRSDDTLLLGRESGGVPDRIHDLADAALRIPMRPGLRSLNVAVAAAMVLGEALRQTATFPTGDQTP